MRFEGTMSAHVRHALAASFRPQVLHKPAQTCGPDPGQVRSGQVRCSTGYYNRQHDITWWKASGASTSGSPISKQTTREQNAAAALNTGKLNWACRVVYGSRTFLWRILDTVNSLSPSGKFRLDSTFCSDITWWVNFLKVFNGTRLFLDRSPTVDVATDACPVEAGGYFRGDWFYHNFSLDTPAWEKQHINHKETLAIILAAKRWGRFWSNQCIIIHSDNQAAIQIINKGTTASAIIMNELRTLFWLSALNNFHITAVYLEGAKNMLADSYSHMHEPKGSSKLLFVSLR